MSNTKVTITKNNRTTTLCTADTYCPENIDIITAIPMPTAYLTSAVVNATGDTLTLTNQDGATTVFKPEEFYACTYGTTTYNSITSLVDSGRIPYVKTTINSVPVILIYACTRDNTHYLTAHADTVTYIATCDSNSTWASTAITPPAGTVTSVAVKMNNTTKGTVTTSGTIDLGTVITAHQDISGKENTSNKATSISSSSTSTQYAAASAVYNFVRSEISAALSKSY